MIRCIIVDDEPLAQEILETYVGQHKRLLLIKTCSNALEAFNVLHNEQVDLILLDIKMPGISGLDFVRSLKNPPAVIFTTAFANYAVTGFELDAVDYLLKPIVYERFEKAIDKLLKTYRPEIEKSKDYTYFKISGKLIKIYHCDLLYARCVKDYISLVTKNGNFITHMTMKYLTELLSADLFVRVHRSYLVNRNEVERIEKNNLKIGPELIPIGENYKGINWG